MTDELLKELNERLEQCVGNEDVAGVIEAINQGADVNLRMYENPLLLTAVKLKNVQLVNLMLDKGADINIFDASDESYGDSALILASSLGNIELINLLIKRGADINQFNNNGETALAIAAENGSLEIVSLLIDKGADVNYKPEMVDYYYQKSPLISAISKKNNDDVINLLLSKGAHVNFSNTSDDSPLRAAIESDNDSAVEILLANDANINLVQNEFSALSIAARLFKNALLKRFIEINVANNIPMNGSSLIEAAKAGNNRGLGLLLGAGADINEVFDAENALIAAIKADKLTTVNLLLAAGANDKILNDLHTSPLIASIKLHNKSESKITQMLISRGLNVNLIFNSGTALDRSIEYNDRYAMELLLKAGADVNLEVNPMTSLMLSAKVSGHATQILLDHGAHINENKNGTALMEAAAYMVITSTIVLINAGADVNLQCPQRGYTALMYAASGKRGKDIVIELLNSGADTSILNYMGLTALDIAKSGKLSLIANIIEQHISMQSLNKISNNKISNNMSDSYEAKTIKKRRL